MVKVIKDYQRPQVVDVDEADENQSEDEKAEGSSCCFGEIDEAEYSQSDWDKQADQLEDEVSVDEPVVVLSNSVDLAASQYQIEEDNRSLYDVEQHGLRW